MTGLKLRIAILILSVLSFFYYRFVPYFPDGIYYKNRMNSAFTNLNEELRRLETGLRQINSISELENLQLEFPIVSGLKFATESDLSSRKDPEGKLLKETLKDGTSRLFFLKPSLVFCLPDPEKKKLILAELREDLFRISFSGVESMLIPDLKFGGYAEPGGFNKGRISFLLIEELSRSEIAVNRIEIGSSPFIGYYYATPENSYGFLKGILILKPGNDGLFFLFLSGFLILLFLIDFMIRILRIKRNFFTHKEGKEIQEIIGQISKRIDALQTAKQKAIESTQKNEVQEIQTLTSEEVDFDLQNVPIPMKEVKQEDGPSIFVLPFELKREGYVSPAFLRDPEKFKEPEPIAPEIEKKRSEIFTPELQDLISKVNEPIREKPNIPIAKQGIEPEPISADRTELGPGYMKWLNTLPVRERRKILEVLDELRYGLESEYSFILKYYISVFLDLKLSGFAIHYYDRRNGSYNPFVTQGLRERTSGNMIFLYDDQYIGKESGTYSIIEITDERKMDRFFRKKFDPIDLEICTSILTIPLSNFGIPFRFFLFFKDPLTKENAQEIENLIFHSLEPVIPAFEEYDRKILGELFRDKRDVVSSRVHLMRIATDGERGLTRSFKIEFHGKDFKTLESLRKKTMSQISEIIGPEDICFGIGIGAFGLHTRKNLEKQIRSLMDQTGNSYDFVEDIYPENGKNLFIYL
ncbi:hypothetical protein LEP1GSC198_2772 [Leptospira kirschneri str. JB]|uniref:hypothetical protein n=1 Tax=Leptospira kirschneri TaxID=29507 RepID=UPI0002BF1490|nr:hypothetical protein [Leptospira kirschneri]EMJ92864.1 hypothetical protein LEP1GSC198_2772 [Leptospira kirschneri str. JB]